MTVAKINIEFGSSVAGDAFDYVVADALLRQRERLNGPVQVELDFRRTCFIDIVSCQLLIALVISLRGRNWWPILRLPRHKPVRDFWRLWEYPAAFKAATGVAFSRLVLPEEHHLLSEPQTTYFEESLFRIHQDWAADRDRDRPLNFFGFVTKELDQFNPTVLADREAGRWGLSQVQDVLKRHLGDRADYMPSRVIFEAYFNAAKHPEANLIQIASWHKDLSQRTDGRAENTKDPFIVVFWDNGKSIVETLRSAIEEGLNIREGYQGGYDKKYFFKSKSLMGNGTTFRETIDSAEVTPSTKDSGYLLATALFPGITSRPESLTGDPHAVSRALLEADINLTRRGMGLYVLMNAVVDVLGGTVGIRTDRFFLNVEKLGPRKAKKEGADTELSIVRLPENLPRFEGNLIVVRVKSRQT